MKLSIAFLAAAAPALVSAKTRAKKISPDMDLSNVEIKAQTKTGNNLLSKARRLDGGDETTWVAGYSLKFHSCTSSQDYYGGQFANDEDGYSANYQYNDGDGNNNYNNQNGEYQYNGNNANGNSYYNNEQRYDYQGMYQQKLVHFKLCPSDSCRRCKNGADYVVDLNDFVDAILEAQMTQQEYMCEHVRENCYCENANSQQQCQYNCFKNAGIDYCGEEENNENEFDLQEAIECTQLEVDEEAAENYYFKSRQANQYQYYGEEDGQQQLGDLYVGPYCSKNGKNIFLGAFMDETCSYPAPAGIYEALHYGDSLPYAKKSLVPSDCISCEVPQEVDYENYYEQQQEAPEVTEVCATLYENAGKCEEGLDGYFPNRDRSACSFIKTLKATGISMPSANIPAKVFAGIFAVTTVALAGVAAVLAKKNRRQNVSLAGDSIIS